MAGIVYTKLIDALKGIGVDVTQQSGSNVKKLAPKNKSTATKVGLLAAERDKGGNFATVLDIFKDEAKYIDSMNDAEQMAFLNNILDYNEFGGKSFQTSEGIRLLDESKKLTDESKDLKTSIDDLTTMAKSMKDEAEAGKKKALQDLDDFFKTGGQPFKKKDDKFLGGSMHEESQLRTGIRQFLQTEYKNGRLKLDDLDKERVMQYSPMIEHDPILVFKKIYGEEAYNKAGTFPGAFEKGESFNHYEQIFRENMGEDLLKVKNKEYVGDGKLILTEQEEVFKPTPDDDDIPFAKGGRASFAGGKLVSEIIAAIVKKEPIEAMKEVNKVVGKKGKYKNLTKEDINKIVEGTDDWIMQRDPDNLYVYDDGKTIYDDDLTKEQLIEKEGRAIDKADEMSVEDSLVGLEGLGATKTAERFRLKQKYPGITDDLLNKILIDDNPQRKAEVLATIDEAFKMMEKGKSTEEIIETFKNTTRTKNAKGGRAGFSGGGSTMTLMDGTIVQIPAGAYKDGKFKDIIYSSSKGDLLREEIVRKLAFAKGGRAGFYLGGQSGQSVIEPDLSDIGHGSDSLMSRTRMLSPNAQATTSTGLNYLLGEDNDNTRVPFNDGLLVPPAKPYTLNQFDKDSMMLLQGIYGTGKATHPMLYNSIIDKGNKLRKQGVERETVIEIIRKNKDKINAFLETQTTTPKTFKGIDEFEMKANGGRIGYATKGKVSLSDLESLQGLKKARDDLNFQDLQGIAGQMNPRRRVSPDARSQRSRILDKAIAKFSYAVDNLDQETREKVISAFNDQLKIGYETTMSGLKMDAAEKLGFVPIDKETIYKAIVNMDLPKKTKLKISALSNTAGDEELEFSLINNNLGITYDNQSQTIVGKYNFDSKDGKLSITPSITKDQDSQIQSKIEINKAIKDGQIDLDVTKDTTDNSLTTNFGLVKDGNVLLAKNVSGTDNDYFEAEGTAEIPFAPYLFKDGQKPYISSEYLNKNDSDSFTTSLGLPFTKNLLASVSNVSGDGINTNTLGINYKKYIDNIFTKNKSLDNRGTFTFDANIDSDKNRYAGIEFRFPLGGNKTENMQGINFDTEILSPYEKELKKQEELKNTMFFDGKKYRKDNIYSGSDLNELIDATKETFTIDDLIGPKLMAQGGIANLRPGYAGGSLVDKGRRGFLKLLGGTAAGVVALKTGLAKLLGKESGAISKKVIDEVIIEGGTGAPAWLQPLVNKALREGTDKTKSLAYKDAQEVKRLDTPTGQVDVYYDVRTGEVEIDYIGGNTALGESVQMRYTPGIADEGTGAGGRPADEFEATEAIPEGRAYAVGDDVDYAVEMGENTVGDVKGLYSDTTELAELGGQKPLIKDISETIKKKKVLKKMNENPTQFAAENAPDYDYLPDYDPN